MLTKNELFSYGRSFNNEKNMKERTSRQTARDIISSVSFLSTLTDCQKRYVYREMLRGNYAIDPIALKKISLEEFKK